MSDSIHAWAAPKAGGKLESFEYTPGPLGPEEVELRVESCGICHSDLSMIDNDWGQSVFPLVAGHEVVGIVESAGEHVKGVKVGDRVGLGWFAGSCMSCRHCLAGNHNLCTNAEQTIVGRHGGFADRVRCHWSWAIPIPGSLDALKAGPLFCGGITVFGPIAHFGVKPTDRVGVVGIGGLGHLALQFLDKWGCHVTAFTSSDSKAEEAKRLGADSVVNSRDSKAMEGIAGSFDFILVTANVPLDWDAYLAALAPDGRLHFVGAVLEPIPVPAFALIGQRKSISGSPLGGPATVLDMLDFCGRHDIAPQTEVYPMDQIHDALDHLRAGKARYRVVLER
ncbi:alcohol dehydrogenase [Haloferula helveola]|uniref:Alcohol dehydrogenase n=1 Tax=Haloferula helveola TaxID=490095 RepID=A0ABM7RL67_9BACT|nr:alcohol dehydrogenase [Haloferula helveola]